MRKVIILTFFVLSLSATPVYALWCDHALVSIGDHKTEVLNKCGDPINIDRRVEYLIIGAPYGYPLDNSRLPYRPRMVESVPPGQAYLPVEVEEWIYNFGSHQFMQLLRFENGILKEIRSLDWGY
jgi:hypothetical protein